MVSCVSIQNRAVYYKKAKKNIIFILKIQLHYPFVSISLCYNNHLNEKEKDKLDMEKERDKIKEALNIDKQVYESQIDLLKRMLYGAGFTSVTELNLPLMLRNFCSFYKRAPEKANYPLLGVNLKINMSFMMKFSPPSIWNFFVNNQKRYGMTSLENPSALQILTLKDYSNIPIIDKNYSPEKKPLIFFILYNNDNESKPFILEKEQIFYLEESNVSSDYLQMGCFIIYERATLENRIQEIQDEVHVNYF